VEVLALQVNAWGLQVATQALCASYTLVVLSISLYAHRIQLGFVFVHPLAHTTDFSSAQPALMLHTHENVLTGLMHHRSAADMQPACAPVSYCLLQGHKLAQAVKQP